MVRLVEKNKVVKLRLYGKSINEISEKLDIPKSTVSIWCRGIQLGQNQIRRLAERVKFGSRKGRIKFLEKIRKKRKEEIEILRKRGIREIGKLNKRDLFIAGVGMYWSEGYTYPIGNQVGFTNSDSRMIMLILKWFREICKVSEGRFTLQVKINQIHKDRIKKVENYWSNLTSIPLYQFNKTVLIKNKAKKVYLDTDNYFGTLRITIRRGTKLRRNINGWIEGLARM